MNLHLIGSELSNVPVPSTLILLIVVTISPPFLPHSVLLTTSDRTLLDFVKCRLSHNATELSVYTLVFCSILSLVSDMLQENEFQIRKASVLPGLVNKNTTQTGR